MKRLVVSWAMFVLAVNVAHAQSGDAPRLKVSASSASNTVSLPKFKVLALAEPGGHHVAFTTAAKPWLKQCGEENGFEVDYISDTKPITEGFLAQYQVVLQLDFVPYGWKPEAMAALKAYVDEGRGGWVGLHHATLLGNFDGQPLWPWFWDFMGKIKFKNYIPTFASGSVHVEDNAHPCMKGLPGSFSIPKEEWYTYDRSPRTNVHVLASVDESTYSDPAAVKMGDHPVIWTNPQKAARNIYIFMGHGPDLFENRPYAMLLRNAIIWAAEKPAVSKARARSPVPAFDILAFYTGRSDQAHISFVREANEWFSKMAAQTHFSYRSTTNWAELNERLSSERQVVLFLDTRPEDPVQRQAFKSYMDKGGAWMGFHFAGFALTPSAFPQNWDWYHNEFLGAGSYAGNTWRPTSAVLRVEAPEHPATRHLPATFTSAPSEWYKWSNDLRTNADIRILLSIDPASYPLGTGPKPHEIWRQGYFPVVWTNKRYRMIYFNMGHNDIDYEHATKKDLSSSFDSEPQNRLILDSLLWLGMAGK